MTDCQSYALVPNIEAGANVDFNCVILFLVGLNSIAQATGRCNQNGLHTIGEAPQAKRLIVNYLESNYQFSEHKSCRLI